MSLDISLDGKQAIIKNDYEDLVESAIEVLKDKKLAKRLGVSGKKFVQENYTWQKRVQKIYEYFGVGKK